MTDLEIRDVPETDLDQMIDFSGLVFHQPIRERDYERWRWMMRRAERIGARVGDVRAGQLAALPMRLAVPGGLLDCSAVTAVGVLPTHRRRGVLTAMIDRMHADAAAAGRPVAALWASEGAIYGRYGFGLADRAVELEIDTSRPLALRTEPDPRPLRLVDPADAPAVLGPLHEAALARRPGGLVRDEEWWIRNVLPDEERSDDQLTAPRVVVHPEGYAIYRTGRATVRLEDLVATDARVEAALWQYLAGIDLTSRIKAPSRPVDDLLPHMAADPDQVKVTGAYGAMWLRLVEVPAALRARSWASSGTFVLDVADARIPANHGWWRLTTGAAPACEPTADDPDLSLSAADLGAVYLGGNRLSTLVRIGAVTERTPGAAERLDAALAVPLAPYTNDDF
ncbi:GNAT family N-acetyltransferase [Actinomadura opuntiae]|uniref:GNAT family N-acetyltransferase n=1 Tax=Actinomadura sp. OS1-43 TaxID=604315 RepID=UPI00255B01A7|nr:GNAT family N-acetyltransferase [Actinomadura sp. OS1-43]MDL4816080.1 GNAT family N-acetyltransferase [Actinomadura sp. OS1-43]